MESLCIAGEEISWLREETAGDELKELPVRAGGCSCLNFLTKVTEAGCGCAMFGFCCGSLPGLEFTVSIQQKC